MVKFYSDLYEKPLKKFSYVEEGKKFNEKIKIFNTIIIIGNGCVYRMQFNGTNTTAETAETTETATTTAVLTAVISPTSTIAVDPEFTDRDVETSYDDETATHIMLDGGSIQVTGDGATSNGSVLTISQEGTYVVTGTLSDGQIIVDAGGQ
ncbi:carbohydrate-binding domain-containing protein [Acetobacterium tundrae]|uniref:Carbohydrate-binding domain-containing protein n=1 Tax=Acetobacterium tundrae TaxID=132932 RepID=A0ABR6WPI0_9FIRM|nr:carbohydrate-binding domain-containing protein [Acetobacterium tundrae]MBC3798236.1 carbohydrate-binding domain-containing protein [Acetobacterium tundrae]